MESRAWIMACTCLTDTQWTQSGKLIEIEVAMNECVLPPVEDGVQYKCKRSPFHSCRTQTHTSIHKGSCNWGLFSSQASKPMDSLCIAHSIITINLIKTIAQRLHLLRSREHIPLYSIPWCLEHDTTSHSNLFGIKFFHPYYIYPRCATCMQFCRATQPTLPPSKRQLSMSHIFPFLLYFFFLFIFRYSYTHKQFLDTYNYLCIQIIRLLWMHANSVRISVVPLPVSASRAYYTSTSTHWIVYIV